MSNQTDLQQSVRSVTGTAYNYNADWSALFDQSSIAADDWNGRMLGWLNSQLGGGYFSLPEAQQAYAAGLGFTNWSALNTISNPQTVVASDNSPVLASDSSPVQTLI